MSLLPLLFDDPFDYHSHSRPSRILDQHFGLGLTSEDLLAPFTVPRHARSVMTSPSFYMRPWRTPAADRDVGSTMQIDKDKFQANLDVQQFAPNEITVKVTGDNQITIEGKHEEKKDEHGYISRQFMRRYVLPKECDINKVESKLSTDGVLTITAPRVGDKQVEHREIPITSTGKPSKPIENKKEDAAVAADKK